jgi:hypothetical protein
MSASTFFMRISPKINDIAYYFSAENYFINGKKLDFSLYLILGFFTMPFDEKNLIVKWMAE